MTPNEFLLIQSESFVNANRQGFTDAALNKVKTNKQSNIYVFMYHLSIRKVSEKTECSLF